MPIVCNNDGQDIYLARVDQYSTAEDAARELWSSVHNAAKIFGGRALLRTPDDGEFGFSVRWEAGPHQWAQAYVVSEGADAPSFTTEADDAVTVRFTDLS